MIKNLLTTAAVLLISGVCVYTHAEEPAMDHTLASQVFADTLVELRVPGASAEGVRFQIYFNSERAHWEILTPDRIVHRLSTAKAESVLRAIQEFHDQQPPARAVSGQSSSLLVICHPDAGSPLQTCKTI